MTIKRYALNNEYAFISDMRLIIRKYGNYDNLINSPTKLMTIMSTLSEKSSAGMVRVRVSGEKRPQAIRVTKDRA